MSIDTGSADTIFVAPRGSYYIRVLARNPCGTSSPSNELLTDASRQTGPARSTTLDSTTTRSIFYIVDPSTLTALRDQIARFAEAVSADTATVGKVIAVTGDPFVLRQLLKEGYEKDNLWGAFLIGGVPAVSYRIPPFTVSNVSDHFYRAFNAPFRDDDRDGLLEVDREANILTSWLPQIWVSRLRPSRPGSEGIGQLADYFEKNLRSRQSVPAVNRSLHFLPALDISPGRATTDDISAMLDQLFDKHPLYERSQVDFTPAVSASEQRASAIALLSGSNEIGYINVHGTPTSVCFTAPGSGLPPSDCSFLTSDMLSSLRLAGPRYLSLISCSTGQFTAANYFAGEVLFSSDVLFIEAFTSEALVFDTRHADVYRRDYYAYGVGASPADTYTAFFDGDPPHFLGDPTIRLRRPAADPPVAEIRCLETSNGRDYPFDFGETSDSEVIKACEVANSGGSTLVLRTHYFGAYATLNGGSPAGRFEIVDAPSSQFEYLSSVAQLEVPAGASRILRFRFQPENGPGTYEAVFRVVTNDPRKAAFRITARGKSQ